VAQPGPRPQCWTNPAAEGLTFAPVSLTRLGLASGLDKQVFVGTTSPRFRDGELRAGFGALRAGDEALEFVEPVLDLMRRHPSTRTTTRRFFARPSRSSLDATGWSSP